MRTVLTKRFAGFALALVFSISLVVTPGYISTQSNILNLSTRAASSSADLGVGKRVCSRGGLVTVDVLDAGISKEIFFTADINARPNIFFKQGESRSIETKEGELIFGCSFDNGTDLRLLF
jgi:hypothetical protein